jgi:SNF2 family DNA or RNA helicase
LNHFHTKLSALTGSFPMQRWGCSWIWALVSKTVIALTAICELKYNRWSISKALVIAPKKVSEATWGKEAEKWDHLRRLRVSVVSGTERQRIAALCAPADVYVIARDNTAWLVDYYMHSWPFGMVVIDEFSSFKNSRSKRFKAIKLVRSRIGRLVGLTGTPSSNGLIDLWAQIYMLDGGARLGRTLGEYRERFFDPDKRSRTQIYSYAPKDGSMEYIQRAIGDICISMKAEDYLDLPDCLHDEMPVALDAPAAKAYKRLEREMLLEVDGGAITAGTAGILAGKLLQLCNGAVYDADRQVHELHKCKIEAFLELLEQLGGQSALVFYSFQHDRDRLLAALAPLGLRVRAYRSPADEDDWNNGEIDVLLAHPASCAYGLNLQNGGHHVVWFGLTWSLEQYEQANKRLHRQGQRHPVVVHTLAVQGGMDEDVIAALRRKGDVQGSLMDALRVRIGNAKSAGAQRPTIA